MRETPGARRRPRPDAEIDGRVHGVWPPGSCTVNTESLPGSLAFERRPLVPLRLFAPLRDKLYLAGISLVPFRSAQPRIDPSILTEL